MYNFFIQAYAGYKGLFYWLNWPGYISGAIVQPFASVIMYSILGRFARNPSAIQEYVLGIAVFSMAFIIMAGIAQSYNYERTLGTMSFVFISSTNRLVNFTSRLLFHYPNALISFGFGLFAAWVIVGLSFETVNWIGLGVAVLVIAASLTAAGQILGVLSIAFRNWVAAQGLALGIILVFTGIIIPINVFPSPISEFTQFLPVTNGLLAARAAFAGATVFNISPSILREAMTGLGYFILGFIGFLFFEKHVKRDGTLDMDTVS